ncbi:MAG TPA: AI-2E family transporter [Vicinamibacterales bacterium]|nr:AI-2E family transporter [Vicinamibacterales bacterium]
MRVLVGAASLVIVVAGLKTAAPLLIPLVIASFLAVACFPLVQWMRARGLPTSLSVALTAITVVLLLVGPVTLVTTAVQQFARSAPSYQQQLAMSYETGLAWLLTQGVDTDVVRQLVDPTQVFGFAVASVSGLVRFASVSLLIALLTVFMLIYGASLAGRPGRGDGSHRGNAARIIREVAVYLRVKTAISLTTGLAAGLLLFALDVDSALLWGLLTFLLNYLPTIGSIIAAVPPVVLAFLQHGSTTALVVLVGYLGINQVLSNIVEPYLTGQRLRIAPLAVLLSVIVWGWIWGPVGALLSTPMTMVIKIGLENSSEFRWVAQLLEGRRPDFSPFGGGPSLDG